MMFKITVIVFISLFSLLTSAAVKRKKRESVVTNEAPKWIYQPRNYSDKLVDVLLLDPSQLHSKSTEYIPANSYQKGLIELFLPGAPESLFLCFPQNTEDYRQAYILSHIICRQMGFMTFMSMNSKLSTSTEDKIFHGLKPNSFSCTGQEQNVSHCEWNNINIGGCRAITDLTCGDCQFASRDASGFLEVPGYPLVNLHDVTCEWDLLIEEAHSVSLSFHHFHTLFEKSSKLFCSLQEPYMDVMYGSWNKINYQRYCNSDDVKNLTVPRGGVKIRIFTGVYAPYGLRTDVKGKGVAITFEAKPNDKESNWNWKITFVALFILIFIIAAALFHYCKKLGMCDRQNSNTLPTGNDLPTLADLDRAYEFQRCAIQGPVTEKMGLRMRSIGSGGKVNNIHFPSYTDETFIVSSAEAKNGIHKENIQHYIYNDTPRTIIPEIILTGADDTHPIERVKANLLDRFSKNSCDLSGVSDKVSISSPLVFPSHQGFKIYSSVSSDTEIDMKKPLPPPYESAL